MIPAVGSRLLASASAFAFGFLIANIGLIFIDRPDQVLWIVIGAVFMATGALGVLVADSQREFSWWSVFGMELSVLAVGVPLLWLFSLSLSSGPATSLWPQDRQWSVFAQAWQAGKHAILNTVIVTAPPVILGCVLAALAAVATVRGSLPGRRVVVQVMLGALFMPAFALAGPMATQAYAFGLHDHRWFLAGCVLTITVPLAWWMFDRIGHAAPWVLRDSMRADGATVIHRLWHFWTRCIAPSAVGVVAIVFIVAAGDVVLGLAMTSTPETMTLSAWIASAQAPPQAMIAALTLWCLIPALVVAAAFNRMIVELFTRRSR